MSGSDVNGGFQRAGGRHDHVLHTNIMGVGGRCRWDSRVLQRSVSAQGGRGVGGGLDKIARTKMAVVSEVAVRRRDWVRIGVIL